MPKQKIALLTLITAISLAVYFFLFHDPYLQYYSCKNSISAQNCNSCKVESQKFKFLIDKDKNTVLQKSWMKNKLVSSEYLENCIVTNQKNWICKTEDNISPKLLIIHDAKMIDGVFINLYEWIEDNKFHQPGELSAYFCAK